MRLDDAVTYFLSEWPVTGAPPPPGSRRHQWVRPSAETVRTYGWQLKWLVGFAAQRGKVRLSELDADIVRAAMVAKETPSADHPPTFKGGEAAANSLACAARALARWLLAQGVPVADLESLKPPRVPERIQPRLRGEEFPAVKAAIVRRLVDGRHSSGRALVDRDLALVHLMYDTGLRAFEICSMTLDSIDFDTGSVLVFRGKGSKPRALSVVDPEAADGGQTLQLLANWIRARSSIRGSEEHRWLWVNAHGNQLSRAMLRKALAAICAEAGLPGNRPPHAFRRANFTEHYLDDPGSIDVLRDRMGWERNSDMVAVYTRGAEIDFARTTPLPSLSARWTAESPKVPYRRPSPEPMPHRGVGPQRVELDDAPPPLRGRVSGERAGGQPARGRRPLG